MIDVAAQEVPPARRVLSDLVERAAAGLSRTDDDGLPDEDPRAHGRDRARDAVWPEPAFADERVREEEGDRAEGQMHLARKWNRRERRARKNEPPGTPTPRALERPQGERQERGDRAEEVSDALRHAVRGDGEHKPADERRAAREAELAQPGAGAKARERVDQELDEVPAPDESERGAEGPE